MPATFIAFNLRAVLLSFAILAAPFVLVWLEKKNPRKELSLSKIRWGETIVKGFALFALVFLVLIVQGLLLKLLGLLDNEIVVDLIAAQETLTLVLAVTVGPIGEELLFRGYLLNKVGVWAQAFLFGLLHFSYGSTAEILAAFTVAALFGLYMKREKNIYACITAHALYNLMSIIAVFYLVPAG